MNIVKRKMILLMRCIQTVNLLKTTYKFVNQRLTNFFQCSLKYHQNKPNNCIIILLMVTLRVVINQILPMRMCVILKE